MPLSSIAIIILLLVVIGAFPAWPYAANFGYGPFGVLGLVLVVLLIAKLLGGF